MVTLVFRRTEDGMYAPRNPLADAQGYRVAEQLLREAGGWLHCQRHDGSTSLELGYEHAQEAVQPS